MYIEASNQVFLESTIINSWAATGLVPFNPARVLDSLITHTLSLSAEIAPQDQLSSSPWQSETPRTQKQLDKQTRLLQNTIQRGSQSPSESLAKIIKSAQLALSAAALLAQENHNLQ